MNTFFYIEINVIGIIILLLMLFNLNNKHRSYLPADQRLFNLMVLITICVCIADTGMWFFDGQSTHLAKELNYLSTTVYYILNPGMCFLWVLYTDYKLNEDREGLQKRLRLYAIPVTINFVLSVLSPWTKWLFVIDDTNHYIRGDLFYVMACIAFGYLAYALMITIKDMIHNSVKDYRIQYVYLISLPSCLLIASVLQTMFFGISIIWICSILALLSVYINMQNVELSIDHLTGLYNRRRFDNYFRLSMRSHPKDKILFGIQIDVDDFKSINDTFGHGIGDLALSEIAQLLRASCNPNEDFIARMGGDEFIIVGLTKQEKDIQLLMSKIQENVRISNERRANSYKLSLSMGYAIFEEYDTLDTFIARADYRMYMQKQQGHLHESKL